MKIENNSGIKYRVFHLQTIKKKISYKLNLNWLMIGFELWPKSKKPMWHKPATTQTVDVWANPLTFDIPSGHGQDSCLFIITVFILVKVCALKWMIFRLYWSKMESVVIIGWFGYRNCNSFVINLRYVILWMFFKQNQTLRI